MTADLPAGGELDALIAERVFPGQRWQHDDKCDATGSCWRCGGCLDWCPIPPPYSTDIAAAWLVVEKLQEQGVRMDILSDWHGHRTCRVARKSESLYDALGWSETAPLAICRAALRAVRQ